MSRCFPEWFVLCVLPLVCSGCGENFTNVDEAATAETDEAVVDCSVVWQNELMITDLSVIGDARARNNGPWSFGGLMKAMAGTHDEQQFIRSFVESWMQDQNVEGTVVSARPRVKDVVLDPWKAGSASGTYDLAIAPFDLQAIVYRVDLRKQQNTGDGGGEGRFVFAAHNVEGRPLPFTVIFEFGLSTQGNRKSLDWANDWHSLSKLTLGSTQYKQKLEQITNKFAATNAATSLNQLRTNEIALDLNSGHTPVWELREFHIGSDGFFHLVSPAKTPMNTMDGSSTLGDYVKHHKQAVESGTLKLPANIHGQHFSAGSALVPTNTFSWNVPGVSADLKAKFSSQTCNGCHAGDTGTNFLHVKADPAGGKAILSDFVVNTEMPRRTLELKEALGCP